MDLLTGVTVSDGDKQPTQKSLKISFQEESAIEKLVAEILEKWSLTKDETDKEAAASNQAQVDDVDTKLAKLLEANIRTADKKRVYTEEEQKLRARILEDYGQVSRRCFLFAHMAN